MPVPDASRDAPAAGPADEPPPPAHVERALRRLALGGDDPIARGERALADLEAAVRVREQLPSLRRAVAAASGDRAARGERVLAAFEAYRDAAAGDHFHRARGTPLPEGVKRAGNDAGDPHR
ncbi:hypothetical protein [Natronomonas sp. EA1]|uniref:hypothetical protein n=1 Tax=Natronomonas sp. EA1 TaxID=3421655 RepID=UPI003EB8B927